MVKATLRFELQSVHFTRIDATAPSVFVSFSVVACESGLAVQYIEYDGLLDGVTGIDNRTWSAPAVVGENTFVLHSMARGGVTFGYDDVMACFVLSRSFFCLIYF